ncbi:MAG: lasso peptide biosynthesis B2 protein [Chloroflexota bacterium]
MKILKQWRGRWCFMRRLSRSDRLLVIETIVLLGVARLVVMLFPFRWIASQLGTLNDNPDLYQIPLPPKAERIGLAIRILSPGTPWRSLCLEQAIAGKMMLRWRKIPSTLYLGVDKNADHLAAHAWLRLHSSARRLVQVGEGIDRHAGLP